jgi:hypothetical protein
MSNPLILEVNIETQEEVVREMTDVEYENFLNTQTKFNEQALLANPDLVI